MLAACVLAAGLGAARAIPHDVDADLTWSPFQDGEVGEIFTFWTPLVLDQRQTQYYDVPIDMMALSGRQIVGAQQRFDKQARNYIHHMVLAICVGELPGNMKNGTLYDLEPSKVLPLDAHQCQDNVYNDANSRMTFPDAGIVLGADGKRAGGYAVSRVHIEHKIPTDRTTQTRLENVGWTLYHIPAATRPGMLWHFSAWSSYRSIHVPPGQMSYNRGACKVSMDVPDGGWASVKSLRFHAHGRLHSWHAAIMRGDGGWQPLTYDDTGPGRTFQLGESQYMTPPGEGDNHQEPRLRVGDMIQWVCAFNNTEDRFIRGGPKKTDEMCGMYVNVACTSACRAFSAQCKRVASEMVTPALGAPVYALATPWPKVRGR